MLTHVFHVLQVHLPVSTLYAVELIDFGEEAWRSSTLKRVLYCSTSFRTKDFKTKIL